MHDGLADANRFLVYALATLYALAAMGGALFLAGSAPVVLFLSFLLGGAALLVAGQRFVRPPRLSAAIVSIGAIVGGLPLVWTIVVPVAVAVVVASSIALARRASAPA
jgi:hypothetical protein